MNNMYPYEGLNPVLYKGKAYWINDLYDGINYDVCTAEFLYRGVWVEVKNIQILIDLRRHIESQKK